ncbi:MAG: AMP-binding protein [Sediminibacterium sp.]|nr:AMP-binding protein [Sediminibacterium sp.]
MNIKIEAIQKTKEEWLNTKDDALNPLQLEVVAIVRKWDTGSNNFELTTSGSTGIPGKIRLSRDLLVWSANNTYNYLALSNNEKLGCCLPLNKAGGLMMLIRSLIYNWDIHVVPPQANPIALLEEDCTFVSFVPYQLIAILNEEKGLEKLNKIKKILIGGAAIPSSLLIALKQVTCQCYLGYGMTETASHIALQKIDAAKVSVAFDLLPGVDISIEKSGQIAITIHQLGMRIETEDLGELKNGQLVLLGRTQGFINSGGIKVHANQLEKIIESIFVEEQIHVNFVVLGLKHKVLGEAISVVTEGYAINELIQSKVNKQITSDLGNNYKVRVWKTMAQFPIINYKIDRLKLKAMLDQ